MLRIDPGTYFFAALLILTLPLEWLTAALCAAVFHEICHFVMIKMLGGTVRSLQIGAGGAVMETEIHGKGKEFLSAFAGPLGSFLLLMLCHVFPKLAICACIQGLFNLLPIYPLDGGRMLECLLPVHAEKWRNRIELFFGGMILFLAVRAAILFSLGLFPVFVAVLLIIRAVLRKIPCKRRQIRVQ